MPTMIAKTNTCSMLPLVKPGHRVCGDQVPNGVQEAGELGGLYAALRHLDHNTLAQAQSPGQKQTQKAGQQRGADVVDYGLYADTAGGGDAADVFDANDQAAEDQGIDHHLQGVHVDAADELDHGQQELIPFWHEQTEHDAQDQA